MKKLLLCCAVALQSATSDAGSISGQALDLKGNGIKNVTLQIFSQNDRIFVREFSDGNFNFTISNNLVPDTNQGLTAIFSAAGRETVQVNLHARSDNSLNVVLPLKVGEQPNQCCQRGFFGRRR